MKRYVFIPARLGVEWEGYLRRWQSLEGVLQSPVLLEQQVWEQEQEKRRRSCPGGSHKNELTITSTIIGINI